MTELDLVADLTAVLGRVETQARSAPPGPWVALTGRRKTPVVGARAERGTGNAVAVFGHIDHKQATAAAKMVAAVGPDRVLALVAKARKVIERHRPRQLPMAPDGYAICSGGPLAHQGRGTSRRRALTCSMRPKHGV